MVKIQKDNELYDIPDDLLYVHSIGTIGHTWARLENGKVRIGITDYGQKQLKEIVYVELPNRGATVEGLIYKGEIPKSKPIGAIESQKTSIDFFSPISGTIEEKNDEVEDNPTLINQDPYDDGWILIINPTNLEMEKELLWSAEKYAQELEKL
ncbi:MAG: glycine cleavage system protein H [Candidatus Helarchaeota archaeon]|nr:glycine cleavage system protein H [Candidatus Helarchaeota archaeon]